MSTYLLPPAICSGSLVYYSLDHSLQREFQQNYGCAEVSWKLGQAAVIQYQAFMTTVKRHFEHIWTPQNENLSLQSRPLNQSPPVIVVVNTQVEPGVYVRWDESISSTSVDQRGLVNCPSTLAPLVFYFIIRKMKASSVMMMTVRLWDADFRVSLQEQLCFSKNRSERGWRRGSRQKYLKRENVWLSSFQNLSRTFRISTTHGSTLPELIDMHKLLKLHACSGMNSAEVNSLGGKPQTWRYCWTWMLPRIQPRLKDCFLFSSNRNQIMMTALSPAIAGYPWL